MQGQNHPSWTPGRQVSGKQPTGHFKPGSPGHGAEGGVQVAVGRALGSHVMEGPDQGIHDSAEHGELGVLV